MNQDQCKWIEVVNSIPVHLITTTHLIGILLIQFEQLESILLFGRAYGRSPRCYVANNRADKFSPGSESIDL